MKKKKLKFNSTEMHNMYTFTNINKHTVTRIYYYYFLKPSPNTYC